MGPGMRGMDVVVSPGEGRRKRGDDIHRIPTSPGLRFVPRLSLKAILKTSSRPPQDLLLKNRPRIHLAGSFAIVGLALFMGDQEV